MGLSKFEQKILEKVKKIPRGKVTTYKELARAVGCDKASRAVGNALNKNLKLITIPCHRIVRSDGQVGGYKNGVASKKKILAQEGVLIRNNRVIDFNKILWKIC